MKDFLSIWVGGIEIALLTACHSGAAPAVCQKLAFCTFFEFGKISVLFHLAYPYVCKPVFKNIADSAVLYSAAGINIASWLNRYVAVPSVTAAINHSSFCIFWQPYSFIFLQTSSFRWNGLPRIVKGMLFSFISSRSCQKFGCKIGSPPVI